MAWKKTGPVFLIWTIAILTFGNVFIIPPLILDLMQTLTLSYDAAALLMTSFAIASTVSGIVAGYIASYVNVKNAIILGVACVGIAHFAMSITDYFPLLLVLRGVVGFGTANVWVSSVLYLQLYLPSNRWGKALGGLNASVNIGAAIVLAVVPYLSFIGGWTLPVQLFALSILFFLIATFFLPSVRIQTYTADKSAPAMRSDFQVHLSLAVTLLCIMCFAIYFHVYATFTWIPPYVFETFHLEPLAGGFVSSILALTATAAAIVGGLLVDKTGRTHGIVTIGIAIMLSTGALIIDQSSMLSLMLLLLIVGWGSNMALGPLYALPNMISPRKVAKITGLVGTSGFSGSIVSTYLGGYLLNTTGSYGHIFLAVTIVASIGLTASIFLGKLIRTQSRNVHYKLS